MKQFIVHGTRFHSFTCKLVAVNNLVIATHKGIDVDLLGQLLAKKAETLKSYPKGLELSSHCLLEKSGMQKKMLIELKSV